MNNYTELKNRIWVDIDNERPYNCDIVGLSKTDEAITYNGVKQPLHEGQYIYMYTESIEKEGKTYIFSEGYVIANPYNNLMYKWCCKIIGEIEFMEDYNKRFKR